jgi:SAM-dependent methyltransferase
MSKNSIYTLNTGVKGLEEHRLWNQHTNFFTPLTKGLLPDNIRNHLKSIPSPAVADIACGSGVWLIDLANSLPSSSRLDGFDFDVSKFPAKESLKPNIHLDSGNILEPFPKQVRGVYDLVHVRLIMYGLKADQWEPAAANILTLLKPGGYLLWDEIDYGSWISIPLSPNFIKFISIDVRYSKSVGRDLQYVVSMPLRFLTNRSIALLSTCYKESNLWDLLTVLKHVSVHSRFLQSPERLLGMQ